MRKYFDYTPVGVQSATEIGMQQTSPTVTVGIPVYNGGRTLRHALDSILAQTFTDLEIVISDNASTDDTADTIAEYAARDHRIRSYRNDENLGARANYNRVLKLARGTFFKWAAHDDWIAPEYLERCVGVLTSEPHIVLCYSSMCRVDAENGTRRRVVPTYGVARSPSPVRRVHDVLWSKIYHPVFGVFRTRALRSAEGIPNCPEPDRVTLLRTALLGPFGHVPDVLFFQRMPTRDRNVWTWLDPANVLHRRLRVVRIGREFVAAVASTGLPLHKRAWLIGDICLSIPAKSVLGKVRQLQRRYEIGFGRAKLTDTFIEDWEARCAIEAELRSPLCQPRVRHLPSRNH